MASSTSTHGGSAYAVLYRLDYQSDGSMQISKPDGSGAAADTDDALYVLEEIEQTQAQPQSDGTFQIPFTNYDVSEAFIHNVLNVYAKGGAASSGPVPAAWYRESGVQRGAATASDKPILVIHYGNLEPNTGAKRLIHASPILLDKSSGQMVFKRGQWIQPTVTGKSVSPIADMVIPEELFHSTLVKVGAGGIGDQTLPAYEHYLRKYLTKAA